MNNIAYILKATKSINNESYILACQELDKICSTSSNIIDFFMCYGTENIINQNLLTNHLNELRKSLDSLEKI